MTIDLSGKQLDVLSRLIEQRQKELTAQMAREPGQRREHSAEFEQISAVRRQVENARFSQAVTLSSEMA